ncbi:MAG: PEP-CTERM sorting domain-containing protein [Pirellulales bacterium]
MSCSMLGRVAVLLSAVLMSVDVAYALPGLVLNGDVETDSDVDGIPNDWFHSSGVSYPDDNGPTAPGLKSIQIDSANQDWRSEVFPIVPGAQYRWSFDYKFLPGATGEFRADLRFFDGGSFKGEDTPLIAASNIDQWQTSTRMVNAPIYSPDIAAFPNQADLRLSSNLFSPGNGLVRFDNFVVEQIPEPTAVALVGIALGGLLVVRRRG